MSQRSSRIPGASIRNRIGGYGPPRSGQQTKVSMAPSLVGTSRIFSIIRLVSLHVLVAHASTLLGFAQQQSPGRGLLMKRAFCGAVLAVAAMAAPASAQQLTDGTVKLGVLT